MSLVDSQGKADQLPEELVHEYMKHYYPEGYHQYLTLLENSKYTSPRTKFMALSILLLINLFCLTCLFNETPLVETFGIITGTFCTLIALMVGFTPIREISNKYQDQLILQNYQESYKICTQEINTKALSYKLVAKTILSDLESTKYQQPKILELYENAENDAEKAIISYILNKL